MLAYLIVSKYVDHIPLNRLEQILKRHGIILPRSTQCDWLMACATLLKPLVASMRSDLLKSLQIFTDDTILPLQNDQASRNSLIYSHPTSNRSTDSAVRFYPHAGEKRAANLFVRLPGLCASRRLWWL
ncbi:MAG: transposase [Gammaproteobacteria bacterium]|nr:transposase [Gammaproteobacteria bacterium]